MNLSSKEITNYSLRVQDSFNKTLQKYREGDFKEALLILNNILEENPSCLKALKLSAMLAHANNELEQAVVSYQKIISLVPQQIGAYVQLSIVYSQQKNFERVIDLYNQALEIEPNIADIVMRRSLTLLKTGNYLTGFFEFEKRKNSPYYKDSYLQNIPMWDGSPLNGKKILLYHADHGHGDAIQLARYIPLVKQKGGEVVIACSKSLLRLFSYVDDISQLVCSTSKLPKVDVYIPLFSLPYYFQTTVKTIPNSIPYINLPSTEQSQKEDLLCLPEINREIKSKIGIVWSSGHRERNDTIKPCYRDCPLSLFIDLLSISNDISLYSLQVGTWAREIDEFKHKDRLYDLTPQIRDFADTAALISQLDLVISIDTAVAHLAGAMGMPVWTLLAYDSDWRWLIDRQDSPWYPSMRLFRQSEWGNWNDVFVQVKQTLKSYLNNKNKQ